MAKLAVSPPLDTVVAIETPEHIVFEHRIAGPARRLFAYVVDLIICYGVLFVFALIVLAAATSSSASEAAAKTGLGVMLILLFAAQWVYFVAFEATTGSTPGKRVLGLRVVTVAGRPIGLPAAALRNVLRAADALPTAYLLGVAAMTISSKFQRIGDLVAGTIVVAEGRRESIYVHTLTPPARPEELEQLPAHVTLDPDERAAIELFLRRSKMLSAARERELAEMIAPDLGARFEMRTQHDPSRALALLYERAANAGRTEAPPSSRMRRDARARRGR